MKSFNDFKQQIDEVLKPSHPIERWIHDFVHSKNPKFAGKTKEERINMAKGAYYGAQKEAFATQDSMNATPDLNEQAGVENKDLPHVHKMKSTIRSPQATQGAPDDSPIHGRRPLLNKKEAELKEDIEEDTWSSSYSYRWYTGPDGKLHKRKYHKRIHDVDSNLKTYRGSRSVKEAVEYKGIGTDVVDKKKKLNPQPNLLSTKKTVKDFKEETINEISWDDAYHHGFMGHKPASDSENYKKAYEKGALDSKVAGGMRKIEAPKKIGEAKEEQIDEISKATLVKYLDKAAHDAASGAYAGKDYISHSHQHTAAGDWEASKKKHDMATKEFNRANKRLLNIPKAAVKLARKKTFEEFVHGLAESTGLPHKLVQAGKEKWHIYDTKTGELHSTYNNKKVAMKKYGELNDKHAGYPGAGGLVHSKYGVRKEETVDEATKSRGSKVIDTFFKNREIAQRAFTGQNKPPVYSEKGIETPKPEKKEIKEGGFDNYDEIAKELIRRHGKNIDTGHIRDLEGERDTHRGLDHSEVMAHVKKHLKEADPFPRDERWTELKPKHIKGAK